MTNVTLTEFGFCVSREGRPLVTYASRAQAARAAEVVNHLNKITDSGVIDALLSRQWSAEKFHKPSFVHDGRPSSSWR